MIKRWQTRFTTLLSFFVMLCIGVALILKVFNDNAVFYFSPSEIAKSTFKIPAKPFRLGGLVKSGSISHTTQERIRFIVTDLEQDVTVEYTGLIPSLFQEEQGTVVLGTFNKDNIFIATELLAKHDENYMPKEVADSLKKSGKWKGMK